jgi:hypothetical protein
MFLAALAFTVIGPDLDAQIAQVKPKPAEDKWLYSIPWRLNLTQARIDAQKTGKPIVMWIMNGHPMGCT